MARTNDFNLTEDKLIALTTKTRDWAELAMAIDGDPRFLVIQQSASLLVESISKAEQIELTEDVRDGEYRYLVALRNDENDTLAPWALVSDRTDAIRLAYAYNRFFNRNGLGGGTAFAPRAVDIDRCMFDE